MALLLFLIQVFIISFSGAMQPGPVTATAVMMGVRSRWSGVLLAIGHGIIEFPLMVLLLLGAGALLRRSTTQVTVGLAGGVVLLYMAWRMFKSSKALPEAQAGVRKDRPILAGIVLTGSNPYFLIWWATVGLALATTATGFGLWAFVLFAIVHWMVDLFWVSALSFASFHGATLLGDRLQQTVLKICAAAMLFFALFFIYNAARILLDLLSSTT